MSGLRCISIVIQISVYCLRWLNTVFNTHVSFTFFSKAIDPLVAKNGSIQANNTKVGFL